MIFPTDPCLALLKLMRIGIHAIFGGFLAGLVIPHEGGFAIALCEKIEDLITILLLPIVRISHPPRYPLLTVCMAVPIVLCSFWAED